MAWKLERHSVVASDGYGGRLEAIAVRERVTWRGAAWGLAGELARAHGETAEGAILAALRAADRRPETTAEERSGLEYLERELLGLESIA